MKALTLFVTLISTPVLAQPDYDTNEHICAGAAKFVLNHSKEWQQINNTGHFYENSTLTCKAYLADYDDGEAVSKIITDLDRGAKDKSNLNHSTELTIGQEIIIKALKMKIVLQQ